MLWGRYLGYFQKYMGKIKKKLLCQFLSSRHINNSQKFGETNKRELSFNKGKRLKSPKSLLGEQVGVFDHLESVSCLYLCLERYFAMNKMSRE